MPLPAGLENSEEDEWRAEVIRAVERLELKIAGGSEDMGNGASDDGIDGLSDRVSALESGSATAFGLYSSSTLSITNGTNYPTLSQQIASGVGASVASGYTTSLDSTGLWVVSASFLFTGTSSLALDSGDDDSWTVNAIATVDTTGGAWSGEVAGGQNLRSREAHFHSASSTTVGWSQYVSVLQPMYVTTAGVSVRLSAFTSAVSSSAGTITSGALEDMSLAAWRVG